MAQLASMEGMTKPGGPALLFAVRTDVHLRAEVGLETGKLLIRQRDGGSADWRVKRKSRTSVNQQGV